VKSTFISLCLLFEEFHVHLAKIFKPVSQRKPVYGGLSIPTDIVPDSISENKEETVSQIWLAG